MTNFAYADRIRSTLETAAEYDFILVWREDVDSFGERCWGVVGGDPLAGWFLGDAEALAFTSALNHFVLPVDHVDGK